MFVSASAPHDPTQGHRSPAGPEGLRVETSRDAVDVLLNGPDGTTGKDYLGYTNAPAVPDVLLRGLHRLQLRGDVDHPTASTWRIRPQTDAGTGSRRPLGY
jgi:hypothetical protein